MCALRLDKASVPEKAWGVFILLQIPSFTKINWGFFSTASFWTCQSRQRCVFLLFTATMIFQKQQQQSLNDFVRIDVDISSHVCFFEGRHQVRRNRLMDKSKKMLKELKWIQPGEHGLISSIILQHVVMNVADCLWCIFMRFFPQFIYKDGWINFPTTKNVLHSHLFVHEGNRTLKWAELLGSCWANMCKC